MPSSHPPLTELQARVLGVLVEKQRTVPDIYPLSLNALVAGCNQKNNRDPVFEVGEAQVQEAVDALHARSLLSQSSGARVARYEHNLARALRIPDQAVALLAALMLRGPQTAGELRINSERLHRFADIASVEAFLDELATRAEAQGGPLVVKLERRAGERGERWAHLLCGPVRSAPVETRADAGGELEALRRDLDAVRAEVAELRAALEIVQRGR
jgi:uncharacterized protein YceH (UPF0502 family)